MADDEKTDVEKGVEKDVKKDVEKKGEKPAEGKEKPKVDFSKITSDLHNWEDKNYFRQIGPSVADAYISVAKYTDSKGRDMYKDELSPEEAEKMGNAVYDALGYHIHRRFFDIDEGKYKDLLGFKDPQGNPYVDTVIRYHFQLDRTPFNDALQKMAEDGEKITHSVLEQMLEKNIKHHAGIIQGDILKEVNPEDMDSLKRYIKILGEKHNIDPKIIKRAEKTYDIKDLIDQYMRIVGRFYHEDKKEEEKEKK